MSSGYEQFFKKARQASAEPTGGEKKPARGHSFAVKPDGSRNESQSSSKSRSPKARQGRAPSSGKLASQSPEDTLRHALALRMESKKKSMHRKRRGFPFASAAVVVVALSVAGIGFYFPQTVDWVMSHVEIGAFGQAEATTEKVAAPAPAKKEKPAATTGASTGVPAAAEVEKKEQGIANIKNWSPEELSFFNKLNDRKKELDLREAELNKLDEELHQQKSALDQKIEQLEKMRSEISVTLKTRVTNDQAKVDKLVDFYSTMKPQQASKVIESLNEDLAVEVLDKMKKKNAAEIMNMMDSKKARRLSELLTGYERTPAATEAASSGQASEANAAPDRAPAAAPAAPSGKQGK
jgi:flagellar motility protein MotE (MotC chaperone)